MNAAIPWCDKNDSAPFVGAVHYEYLRIMPGRTREFALRWLRLQIFSTVTPRSFAIEAMVSPDLTL